jgi:hypothetical protein
MTFPGRVIPPTFFFEATVFLSGTSGPLRVACISVAKWLASRDSIHPQIPRRSPNRPQRRQLDTARLAPYRGISTVRCHGTHNHRESRMEMKKLGRRFVLWSPLLIFRGIGDVRSKLTFSGGVRRKASRANSASLATSGSHSFPESGESTRSISGGSEGNPKGEICLTSCRRISSKSHGARFGRHRPPPLWVKGRPPRPGCPGPGPSGPGPPAPGWRWRRRYGRLRDRV